MPVSPRVNGTTTADQTADLSRDKNKTEISRRSAGQAYQQAIAGQWGQNAPRGQTAWGQTGQNGGMGPWGQQIQNGQTVWGHSAQNGQVPGRQTAWGQTGASRISRPQQMVQGGQYGPMGQPRMAWQNQQYGSEPVRMKIQYRK